MKYLLLLLCLFALSCNVRRPVADSNQEATCTAKCYDFLCVGNEITNGKVSLTSKCDGKYIVGKFIGSTPEDYLVCECLEQILLEDGKTIKSERKFVIERKPDGMGK